MKTTLPFCRIVLVAALALFLSPSAFAQSSIRNLAKKAAAAKTAKARNTVRRSTTSTNSTYNSTYTPTNSSTSTNSSSSSSSSSTTIFEIAEQMPKFPGGDTALMQYIASHVNYPTVAAENGVQGKVIVGFVVETDGSVSDVKILRSVDPSLDKEAMRVIMSMPKWTPGKQDGKAVRVKMQCPVIFRMQ